MTVREAAAAGCDTAAAAGLSKQVLAELLAYHPGALEEFRDPRIRAAPRVHLYLQPAAAASLRQVLAAGGHLLTVVSAYRTAAQQVMLYRWYRTGRCSIPLAAQPGRSNHEDGAALDIEDSATWRPHFIRHGWRWQGEADPSHYSYRGPGFVDGIGPLGVLAFQRLHNDHAGGVPLVEDGVCGAATERALLEAPAEGWEMLVPEKIGIVINHTQQQEVIDARLLDVQDGRGPGAYMRVSDWQKYATCPPPTWDAAARDVEFVTTKVEQS